MKKKKNRTSLYFVVGILLIIAFSILVNYALPKEKNEFTSINFSKYKELLTSNSFELIYVGQEGCSACAKFEPVLKQIQTTYSFNISYLDYQTLSASEKEEFSMTASVFSGQWGTPTLLVIMNGEIVSTKVGYVEYDELNGFILEAAFNKISYSKYKELLTSEQLEIIYVGRPGCGYCQAIIPTLVLIQNNYPIVFNYLNTETMTSEDYADISTTASVFSGKWGTPTLLAIKNGQVVASKPEYAEYSEIEQFIKSVLE